MPATTNVGKDLLRKSVDQVKFNNLLRDVCDEELEPFRVARTYCVENAMELAMVDGWCYAMLNPGCGIVGTVHSIGLDGTVSVRLSCLVRGLLDVCTQVLALILGHGGEEVVVGRQMAAFVFKFLRELLFRSSNSISQSRPDVFVHDPGGDVWRRGTRDSGIEEAETFLRNGIDVRQGDCAPRLREFSEELGDDVRVGDVENSWLR
jgi:hypothetical protein